MSLSVIIKRGSKLTSLLPAFHSLKEKLISTIPIQIPVLFNPYVRLSISVSGREYAITETPVQTKTENPEWNYEAQLDIKYAVDAAAREEKPLVLTFSVFDKTFVKGSLFDQKMGVATLELDVNKVKEEEHTLPLNEVAHGELFVKIKPSFDEVLQRVNQVKNATIHRSSKLSNEEQAYIAERMKMAKNVLEKKYGKIKKVPVIAISSSGGGYRAMQAAIGVLSAFEKMRFLNAISYIAGISGSTWAITEMMTVPYEKQETLIQEVKKNVVKQVSEKNFLQMTTAEIKEIMDGMKRKEEMGFALGPMDLYELRLGQIFLSHMKHYNDVYLTDFLNLPNLKNRSIPYPIFICTQIIPEILASKYHKWFEITPHLSGFCTCSTFIPTVALGAKFENGKSQKPYYSNEKASTLLGVCGSAFEASVQESVEIILKREPTILEWASKLLGANEKLAVFRPNPPKFHNFLYKAPIKNISSGEPDFTQEELEQITKEPTFFIVDGGINHGLNHPIIPLLRKERKVDIIIMIDSMTTIADIDKYVKLYKIPFPPIKNIEKASKRLVSIFKPTSPDQPYVIYMPLRGNANYDEKFDPMFNTLKSFYTKEESEKLMGLTEYNVIDNWQTIEAVIKEVCGVEKMPEDLDGSGDSIFGDTKNLFVF